MSGSPRLLSAALAAALLCAAGCRKREPEPAQAPSSPVSAAPDKAAPRAKTSPEDPSGKTASAKPKESPAPAKAVPAPRQPCDEKAAAMETGKPSNALLAEDPTCSAGAAKP